MDKNGLVLFSTFFDPKRYPSGKRVLFSTFSFLLENSTSRFSKRVLGEGGLLVLRFYLSKGGELLVRPRNPRKIRANFGPQIMRMGEFGLFLAYNKLF